MGQISSVGSVALLSRVSAALLSLLSTFEEYFLSFNIFNLPLYGGLLYVNVIGMGCDLVMCPGA